MKNKYRVAFVESIPYLAVLAVIGLSIWLNALIVQDTITVFQAELLGYGLLIGIIGTEIFSLFWLKVLDVEKRELSAEIKQKDKKIEEFERELKRIQNS